MRSVPILGVLREHLIAQLASIVWGDGLLFGREATRPFSYTALLRRAAKAWATAGIEPIGLHECRHSFASVAIAAGVNPKTLSLWMGHSSTSVTLDRHAKQFQAREREEVGLFEAYLARGDTTARLTQVGGSQTY